MTEGLKFIRFTQPSTGLDVVLPRPSSIIRPINTKSKQHHLVDGGVSGGNNTAIFLKYKLVYKDGVDKSFIDSFIKLYLTPDRAFNLYFDSMKSANEEIFLTGKLSIKFFHPTIKHASNITIEGFGNG